MIKTYDSATKEDVIKAFTDVIEEIYSHRPTELHISVDAGVKEIPMMTVTYTTFVDCSEDDLK